MTQLYVHYSSRPEAPEVPPRAINALAGGTGPLGVYAYQVDASQQTFGVGRPYAFTLRPVDPVTSTSPRSYRAADLEHDERRLEDMFDIARAKRLWDKLVAKHEARNATLPFQKIWYLVTHVTRSDDPEDQPSMNQSSCADPELCRRLLVGLGHTVIDDRLGVIYSSEPEQAVFLTNESFEVVSREDIMKKNPPKRRPVDKRQAKAMAIWKAAFDRATLDGASYDESEYIADKAKRDFWRSQGGDPHMAALADGRNAVARADDVLGGPRRVRLPMLKSNPPWAEDMLVATYQNLLDSKQIPAVWLPKLTDLEREGSKIAGRFREFGCGAYGCVYPTMDDGVVLKVTTDDTEMDFATQHAGTLVAPICVVYHTAVRTDQVHQHRPISLLWRESAFDVGRLSDVAQTLWGTGRQAIRLVNAQWDAAQAVLKAIGDDQDCSDELAEWTTCLEEMTLQDDVPILQPLAAGMLKVYREQDIFFGDVHMGNMGCVDRRGETPWVITDPGNIVVFED